MPRNVRNWWITASADGYAQPIGIGPKSKEGGIELTIKQRDGGSILEVLTIRGYADNGKLELWARDGQGKELFRVVTTR